MQNGKTEKEIAKDKEIKKVTVISEEDRNKEIDDFIIDILSNQYISRILGT